MRVILLGVSWMTSLLSLIVCSLRVAGAQLNLSSPITSVDFDQYLVCLLASLGAFCLSSVAMHKEVQ